MLTRRTGGSGPWDQRPEGRAVSPIRYAGGPLFVALALGAGYARQAPDPEGPLRRVTLAGEAREALGRLDAADRMARQGNHADALDEYRRLLLDGGDDLAPE